jgi:hypothetical protein
LAAVPAASWTFSSYLAMGQTCFSLAAIFFSSLATLNRRPDLVAIRNAVYLICGMLALPGQINLQPGKGALIFISLGAKTKRRFKKYFDLPKPPFIIFGGAWNAPYLACLLI